MMTWILVAAMLMLAAAVALALVRVVRGPSTLDRLLAFDAVLVFLVGILVVASIHWHTNEFIELILVITSLGFFTTVVFYYYLNRMPADSEEFSHTVQGREDERP
jgi:multicomponent Na+:H+ antiporter subunit F